MALQKKEDGDKLNMYVKDYFQEWLDINALREFTEKVAPMSSIKEDWLNLSAVSY
eukprot:CAMPEP_0170506948 /NCGR_PEP_ID=MMETSP0208-20121228/57001_1 /TAXON_ID=197538 /ORGANISM="Strombidium inclinatum, Strain S3" /LENGTH=54 /DNA_ID=CAMNT_0010788831 /DNA_START=1230 /DNA_END=1394 /DNA_ORIENTATION=-